MGDTVLVERSGDVIPKVVRVVAQGKDRKPFRMPKHCPVCGGDIVREPGEAASRCINTNCPARLKESVRHFAARGVMDIDGMGDVLVDQLVTHELVKSVADIYDLTVEQLLELERMGKKSAEKIRQNIDASRKRPLSRVLNGLGIPFVGERTAQILADAFGSLDAIAQAQADSGFSGVVLVARDSVVLFEKAYSPQIGKRLTLASKFNIGSMARVNRRMRRSFPTMTSGMLMLSSSLRRSLPASTHSDL